MGTHLHVVLTKARFDGRRVTLIRDVDGEHRRLEDWHLESMTVLAQPSDRISCVPVPANEALELLVVNVAELLKPREQSGYALSACTGRRTAAEPYRPRAYASIGRQWCLAASAVYHPAGNVDLYSPFSGRSTKPSETQQYDRRGITHKLGREGFHVPKFWRIVDLMLDLRDLLLQRLNLPLAVSLFLLDTVEFGLEIFALRFLHRREHFACMSSLKTYQPLVLVPVSPHDIRLQPHRFLLFLTLTVDGALLRLQLTQRET